MDNKTQTFNNLYEEYRKLAGLTRQRAQTDKRGQPYSPQYIIPEEVTRKKVLAKELFKNYEDYFKGKPAEWLRLKQDAN